MFFYLFFIQTVTFGKCNEYLSKRFHSFEFIPVRVCATMVRLLPSSAFYCYSHRHCLSKHETCAWVNMKHVSHVSSLYVSSNKTKQLCQFYYLSSYPGWLIKKNLILDLPYFLTQKRYFGSFFLYTDKTVFSKHDEFGGITLKINHP